MASRVRLFQAADWSGGVNFRDDAFTLATNELADSMNMRIMPQGGLQRRKTATYLNSAAFTAARNVWSFLGNGVSQIIVQDGNVIKFSTGSSTFTSSGTAAPWNVATTGIMRAASMARLSSASSERCYIQRNTERAPVKWDGATGAALTDAHGAYNDNLAAPAGGKMPLARYITEHAGYLFHANTIEAGTAMANRVRFSHPGEPEDYRTNDSFDVGVNDGDKITGIASVGHTLWIFKARSVWSLTGYSPESFQLAKVFDGIGAVGQEAVVRATDGFYFFDGTRGVHSVDGKGQLQWLWEKLYVKLADNTIPATYVGAVTLGWLDHRLFVSVPYSGSTVNKRIFVHDPMASRKGVPCWYVYQIADGDSAAAAASVVGPMLEWRPDATTVKLLAVGYYSAALTGTQLYQMEYDNATKDSVSAAATYQLVSFTSFFQTAWYSAGTPGLKKRWRRPTYIADADIAAVLGVQVYTDYTSLTPARNHTVTVAAQTLGTGALWGAFNWNDGTLWGPSPSGEQDIVRGSGFGNAYAVQLKVTGPAAGRWGMNAIDFRFIPQMVR